MTDRSKPPPGWSHNLVDDKRYGPHMVSRSAPITELEHAWAIYDRETAPALRLQAAEIAAWLASEHPHEHEKCDGVWYYTDWDAVARALLERWPAR